MTNPWLREHLEVAGGDLELAVVLNDAASRDENLDPAAAAVVDRGGGDPEREVRHGQPPVCAW